jgi:hypothetical protein
MPGNSFAALINGSGDGSAEIAVDDEPEMLGSADFLFSDDGPGRLVLFLAELALAATVGSLLLSSEIFPTATKSVLLTAESMSRFLINLQSGNVYSFRTPPGSGINLVNKSSTYTPADEHHSTALKP